ncbi:hypothetical protein OPIT5_26540 [Opitutaceae bacterium TAV5]|nr:hypothetical protein OPIT5_26540 [Opitutaceae bacterium TAV5]
MPEKLTGITDWHTHVITPTEIRILSQRTKTPRIITDADGGRVIARATDATGPATHPFPLWDTATDVEARLRHLDENGVERQILSYAVPLGYDAALTADEIKPLFRGINDDLAALVRRHPDRFSALAALPTSDLAWAAEELERVHAEPGFLGAALPLNAFATLRGARTLAPVFEVAQKHRSHLLIHRGAASPAIPGQPPLVLPEDTEWARTSLLSDSQLAAGAITLGLTDFLDDYPDVTVQIVMLGGAIPYVAEHIRQWGAFSGVAGDDPVKKFRRLYFDPGPYSTTPRSVRAAVDAFGADRILFGSDYGPMPSIRKGIETLDAILTEEERRLIYVENGRALLAAKAPALA